MNRSPFRRPRARVLARLARPFDLRWAALAAAALAGLYGAAWSFGHTAWRAPSAIEAR